MKNEKKYFYIFNCFLVRPKLLLNKIFKKSFTLFVWLSPRTYIYDVSMYSIICQIL